MYNYDDVYFLPNFSEVESRREVNTSFNLGNQFLLQVPVIPANMDTVCGVDMCVATYKAGSVGALHRFMSVDENLANYKLIRTFGADCFVSLGVNQDSKQRFEVLYTAGARSFIIDVAHGHSSQVRDMISYIYAVTDGNCFIVAGNVGTPEAVIDLQDWGADAIKVGLGSGKICTTKDVAGVYTPMFTTVKECAKYAKVPLIADGGIRKICDVAKALAAGASVVMSGYLFAHCKEKPRGNEYRGMASKGAMEVIRDLKEMPTTPEGISITVEQDNTVGNLLTTIKGGLQSAFSYANARNLKEFQERVQVRYLR